MPMQYTIYVAGPISDGGTCGDKEQLANVNRASEIAMALQMLGHNVYWPHGNYLFGKHMENLGFKLTEEFYLSWDYKWLDKCNALFYIAPSHGADLELARAKDRGMKIFQNLNEVPSAW